MQRTIAFDTETFYSKDFTVTHLGVHKYAWDPRCDCYLISVCDGSTTWAGHPSDFDFSLLEGAVVLSHNKAFDAEVAAAKMAQGIWPKFNVKEWHCTANLSAYTCNRRSLAEAAEFLLGVKVSKGMRDWMKGRTWEDAVREGKAEELLKYARDDAQLCWQLWDKCGAQWPEWERRLSNLTIEQGRRGVHVHRERLEAGIQTLQRVILQATDKLPWVAAGRAQASPIGVAEECRKAGIPCPPVKAHDADAAAEWEETYSASQPWVKALKDLRKAKKTLATLETMRDRIRDDGTMGFSLKYFGAHTGRWAGDAGINFQNFNREPLFVRPDFTFEDDRKVIAQLAEQHDKNPDDPQIHCLDIRGLLLPPPGMKIGAVDLSQIEPRVANYLAGNHALLQKIKEGFPIYEAHARESMGWTGGVLKKENKKVYSLAKARVIGLNYGCAWEKFIAVARIMAQIDITEDDEPVALKQSYDGLIHRQRDGKPCEPFIKVRYAAHDEFGQETLVEREFPVYGANSRAIVKDFRETNPLIVAMWQHLQRALEDAVGSDLVIELPSGRKLTYRAVRKEFRTYKDPETGVSKNKVVYTAEMDGRRSTTYGGKIFENICQAVGRDVFSLGLLRTVDAGIWSMWTVHDESVNAIHSPEEGERARQLMAVTPDWLPGCPIEAELVVSDRYRK